MGGSGFIATGTVGASEKQHNNNSVPCKNCCH